MAKGTMNFFDANFCIVDIFKSIGGSFKYIR